MVSPSGSVHPVGAPPPLSFTPTWCTGGGPDYSSTDFLASPDGLEAVGTKLYVVDPNNHRIIRLDIANDVVTFEGWTGRVGPAAGDVPTSCKGGAIPAPGEATNDWCYGGRSQSGYGDGMLRDPTGLTVDASRNLYVADFWRGRICKFAPDGSFVGWIGARPRPR